MRRNLPYKQLLITGILSRKAFGNGPVAVEWSTKSYGPDGPWQAVTVQIGTDSSGHPLSTVDLHPGGLYGSQIITDKVCSDTTKFPQPCGAEPAGLYNPDNSSSAYQDDTTVSVTQQWQWQWRSGDAEKEAFSARNVLDTIRMNTSGGILSAENTTIAAMDVASLEIPRASYLVEVGHLALGGPGNGAFAYETGVTGQTFPGALAADESIPSNSFGLHYGSASLKAPGSLTWGGYDQSRVLGDVGAFNLGWNGGQYNMIMSMLDVQLGVESGSTPFNASSVTGLLRLDPTTDQATDIIPTLPYIYMAPETCEAIAQHLPVVLSSYSNLYIWNTSDPQFARIIQSPSYLAFVFKTSGVKNLTIKIPFQLLNLTLEAPIVSPSEQFFPCQPFHASDGSNHNILGKTFLQAAFLGMNWQQNKFFVAQAPGPSSATENLQSIEPTDETIKSNPISEFASSWEHNWTPIVASPTNTGSEAADPTSASPPSKDSPSKDSRLSTGATAGIAVAVVVGVLAVLFAFFFCLRRRKGGKPRSARSFALKYSAPMEKDSQAVGNEIDGHGLQHEIGGHNLPHEIGVDKQLHEMAGR